MVKAGLYVLFLTQAQAQNFAGGEQSIIFN